MSLESVLAASLVVAALSTTPTHADTTVKHSKDGGVVIHEVKTTPVVAVDQGAGCRTLQELTLAHQNPQVMKHMFGTHRCGIIEVGDKLNLVTDAHTGNDSVVQVYVGEGLFFYVPGYVFGRK